MIIDYIIINIQSHSSRFLVGKRLNVFLIVLVLICIVFFHPIVAFSEESTVIKRSQVETDEIIMSLDDCIEYALKHDPNLKIYEQTQVAQKSLVGQAKSTYFPTLLGGSSYNYQHNKTSKNIGMNNLSNNYYQLNIGVNQLIWDFGRTNAKINMQKYNYEAAGYDLDYAILQTIYAVKTAYVALLAAKANEDIYGRSV